MNYNLTISGGLFMVCFIALFHIIGIIHECTHGIIRKLELANKKTVIKRLTTRYEYENMHIYSTPTVQ